MLPTLRKRNSDRNLSAHVIVYDSKACLKRSWTTDEDKKLKELTATHGTKKWVAIASAFDDRTGKQCRERWFNHLCPGVKKGDWTDEEDRIIFNMVTEYGKQWSKIREKLPGRTDNNIKNRFHTHIYKMKKDNKLLEQSECGTDNVDDDSTEYHIESTDSIVPETILSSSTSSNTLNEDCDNIPQESPVALSIQSFDLLPESQAICDELEIDPYMFDIDDFDDDVFYDCGTDIDSTEESQFAMHINSKAIKHPMMTNSWICSSNCCFWNASNGESHLNADHIDNLTKPLWTNSLTTNLGNTHDNFTYGYQDKNVEYLMDQRYYGMR